MEQCERSEAVNGFDWGPGLLNGLLISIPLWIILGTALAVMFQHGPIGELGSFILMIAGVCETILLRPYAGKVWAGIARYSDTKSESAKRQSHSAKHVLGRRGRQRSDLEKATGRRFESIEDLLRYVEPNAALSDRSHLAVAPRALFRQSIALSALAGAYLQYYFLEVNLQIASLHSLSVFLPVTSMI